MAVLGYDNKEAVKLDFDNTKLKTVKYLAFKTLFFFGLEGFIILQSSSGTRRSGRKHYHVIFNRPVTWTKNLHIVARVILKSHHKGLTQWFIMQSINEGSTLRISHKGKKKPPRIVFSYGAQDRMIQHYLDTRREIKIPKRVK